MSKLKHDDPAAMIPLRFDEAFYAGEIDHIQHSLVCHIAARCYKEKILNAGIARIPFSQLRDLYEGVGAEAIRRRLHGLAPAYIELEVGRGKRAIWLFRLTGAASPPQPPIGNLSEHLANTSSSTLL